MREPLMVCTGVYQIGGSDLTHPSDCDIYLVDGDDELAVIDAGAGQSIDRIIENIEKIGLEPARVKYVIATHGHIDHIGGLKDLCLRLGAQSVAHEKELPAVQEGWPELTAADYYGVKYKPVMVDIVLKGSENKLAVGRWMLYCLHTPGHTPGGISIYGDFEGQRVLFGQDIHGPFSKAWGSNLDDWRKSMQKLLDLKADILCEGHFGIYSPNEEVEEYIKGFLRRFKS